MRKIYPNHNSMEISRIPWADHVIGNGDAAKGRRKNNISQSFSKGIQVLYNNNLFIYLFFIKVNKLKYQIENTNK